MCHDCCLGFKKSMVDSKIINTDFWRNDAIYNTMDDMNRSLHYIPQHEVKLPCCETWDEVRTYNGHEYNDIGVCSHDDSTTSVIVSNKKRKKNGVHSCYSQPEKGRVLSLDGALVFPSYHLMVPGYIGMPQTHVVGSQGNFHGEEGILHGVVDPVTAKNIDMESYATHPRKLKIIRSSTDLVMIPDIHGGEMQKKVQ